MYVCACVHIHLSEHGCLCHGVPCGGHRNISAVHNVSYRFFLMCFQCLTLAYESWGTYLFLHLISQRTWFPDIHTMHLVFLCMFWAFSFRSSCSDVKNTYPVSHDSDQKFLLSQIELGQNEEHRQF